MRTYKHIPTKKLPNPPIFPRAHNRLTPPPTTNNTNLTFYMDGSAENLHRNNAKAGAGVICIEQPNLSIKHSLSGEPLNNQRAELAAILLALQQDHHANITIYSDSLTALEGITKYLQFWDDKNWFGIKNAPEWQAIYHTLISRTGTTSFHWVKGHNGDPNNKLADEWAKESLHLNPTPLPNNFPSTAPLEGMKLQILSQKLAYEKIIDSLNTSKPNNKQLINNLTIAKNDLSTEFNINPPTSKIWTGLTQPIQNNISDFIWKLIHNRLRIGEYFLHIPQLTEAAQCLCKESLETQHHLLLDCPIDNNSVSSLWTHLQNKWNSITPKTPWIKPTLGIILGIGALTIYNNNNKPSTKLTNRYKIFMSKAIWIIWKRQNLQIFQPNITPKTITNDWDDTIRNRIHLEWEVLQLDHWLKTAYKKATFQSSWCQNNILAQMHPDTLQLIIH